MEDSLKEKKIAEDEIINLIQQIDEVKKNTEIQMDQLKEKYQEEIDNQSNSVTILIKVPYNSICCV